MTVYTLNYHRLTGKTITLEEFRHEVFIPSVCLNQCYLCSFSWSKACQMNVQRKRTFQQDVNGCMLQDMCKICVIVMCVCDAQHSKMFILPMSINLIQGYFSIMFEFFIFKKETLEIIVKQ